MMSTNNLQRNCRKNSLQYISSTKIYDGRALQLELVTPENRLPKLSNTGGCNYSEEGKSYSPANFDDALNKNLTEQSRFCEAHRVLPSDLRVLVEAVNYGHPDTYQVTIDEKPEWLDIEKFKLGQRFAVEYLFGLTFCELASLLMCSLVHDNLKTTIYSGNSTTPFKSYKRYLSTVLRINSWFEDDIWDKNSTGYKNLAAVRAMHFNISRRINSKSNKFLNVKLKKEGELWCPLFENLKEDFRSLRPVIDCSPDSFRNPELHFNQCDMSLTQFGFIGLMILYPEKFGASKASKEQLDGLVHVWRVLGYYLGIDDRFNLCQGSIDEVKEHCKNIIDYWFRPSFSNITREWEHMCRCLTEGLSYYVHGVSFEVLLLYLCWVLDIDAPKLYASLSWGQHIMFNVIKITMCVLLRIPGVMVLFNLFLHLTLDETQNITPEKLKLLENKVYDFQSSKCTL